MPAIMTNPLLFKYAAVLGSLLMIAGCLVAGLAYRGKTGERYSPLNHFISELGEVGVSRRAWAFNASAVLCGFLLLPAAIQLGLLLPGWLAKIALVFGALTSIALIFVGFFSFDRYNPHSKAAIAFFRCGLMTVLLYSLAILTQPAGKTIIPRAAGWVGIPTMAAFIWFLYLIWKAHQNQDRALEAEETSRPTVMIVAVAEWAVFVGIVGWFLTLAMLL